MVGAARVTTAAPSAVGAARVIGSAPTAATVIANDPAAALAPGAAGEVTESERNRYAAVLDVLGSFDGGPCFAALPSLGEETGDLTLEAFSQGPEALDRLRTDLETRAGEVPNSVFLPIVERQCAALGFLQQREDYPQFSIYFDMPRRNILQGELLEGRILNLGSDHVTLLIIDNDGKVQNLAAWLVPGPGSARFASRIFLDEQQVDTKQLLMAVASSEPLEAAVDFNRQPADFFFAALQQEIEDRKLRVEAAMIGFSVRRP